MCGTYVCDVCKIDKSLTLVAVVVTAPHQHTTVNRPAGVTQAECASAYRLLLAEMRESKLNTGSTKYPYVIDHWYRDPHGVQTTPEPN